MKKLILSGLMALSLSVNAQKPDTLKLDGKNIWLSTLPKTASFFEFNPKTTARIQFHSDSLGVYMAFWDNGDIYHLGKKLTTDTAIVNGLKAVFSGKVDSLQREIERLKKQLYTAKFLNKRFSEIVTKEN